MDISRRDVIFGLCAAGAVCESGAAAADGRTVIDGVDRYRVMEPMFEGVRVILSKRGEKYSPAYIQGISGAAFRVAGPCPCAPTCSGPMGPDGLLRLLGYDYDTLAFPAGADPRKRVAEVLARIKDEVRAGRPVLVFNAFTTAEWDVVCGFDEEKNELRGRGSYAGLTEYARAHDTRMLDCKDICGVIGAIAVGKKTGAFDARKAENDTLKEAVRFARSTADKVPYPGLQCYERWIACFVADPPGKPDFGRDGYTSGVYRSTQRAAADFLRELKPKYPNSRRRLESAAKHFADEADALHQCRELLFPEKNGQPTEARELCRRAASFLTAARDAYGKGIDDIETALTAIDSPAPAKS